MQVTDLNQVFRMAVESKDATTLELILKCCLQPETILSVIAETGSYHLFAQFAPLIDTIKYEERVGCLFVQALTEGRENELPSWMREYYLGQPQQIGPGRNVFAHCCGMMGLNNKKGLIAQYQIDSYHYWHGVVHSDCLSQFRRVRNPSFELKKQCGRSAARNCIEHLLMSTPAVEHAALINDFLYGALEAENKQSVEYLFSHAEAREELKKIADSHEWQDKDCDFDYWLISRKFFTPNEKQWEQMKTSAPLLYARLCSDV